MGRQLHLSTCFRVLCLSLEVPKVRQDRNRFLYPQKAPACFRGFLQNTKFACHGSRDPLIRSVILPSASAFLCAHCRDKRMIPAQIPGGLTYPPSNFCSNTQKLCNPP